MCSPQTSEPGSPASTWSCIQTAECWTRCLTVRSPRCPCCQPLPTRRASRRRKVNTGCRPAEGQCGTAPAEPRRLLRCLLLMEHNVHGNRRRGSWSSRTGQLRPLPSNRFWFCRERFLRTTSKRSLEQARPSSCLFSDRVVSVRLRCSTKTERRCRENTARSLNNALGFDFEASLASLEKTTPLESYQRHLYSNEVLLRCSSSRRLGPSKRFRRRNLRSVRSMRLPEGSSMRRRTSK